MLLLRILPVLLFTTIVIARDCRTIKTVTVNLGANSLTYKMTCRDNASWSTLQSEIEKVKTQMTNFTTSKLLDISMQNNNLTTIPNDTFANISELKYLELVNNKIQSIHPEAFKSLKNLFSLNLRANEIKELSNATFDGLVSLTTLDLCNNLLVNLPQGIFDKLTNLQRVDLSENQFQFLPGNLFQKNQLLNTVRLLFDRSLATLPSGLFNNLKNLKTILLFGSKLESLPEDLFQGSINVREIYLDYNSLKTLPKKLLQDLRNLEKLSLSMNQIEYLPDDIFSENEHLEELDLSDNHMRTLSESLFSGLRSLRKLQMERNSISIIYTGAFEALEKVEEINLSHNNISDISVMRDEYLELSVFYPCYKLRTLNLSFNKISSLYSDWTTVPPKMFNYLDLSHNHIDRIHVLDMDFKHSQGFRINLSNNRISRIDISEFFERIFLNEERSVIEIIMKNNPLQCDCFLYDFVRYLEGSRPKLQRKLQIEIGNIECSSPEEIKGTLISDLKSKDYRCIASDFEDYEGVCPKSCSRWIKPYEHKLVFDCAFRNLTEAPKTMCNFVIDKYKVEVNLTGNFIKNIPDMNQTGYDRVEKLVLSNNNISTITKNVFSPTLLTLELDNNKINTLSPAVLAHLKNNTLKNITLGGNPWKCDCSSRHFHHFIHSSWNKDTTQVLDVEKITCQNSKIMLKKMTLQELCINQVEIILTIGLVIVVFGLIVCILRILYSRNQRKIKIWLHANQKCFWFVTEADLDNDEIYDAFVSYSEEDEDFVVNELVPKLKEGPRPFKLCIHFRDSLHGEWIPTQIAKSASDSKRTIVVVSPNFLQSEWGRLEFRAAVRQALKDRERIVVILYGDIDPTHHFDPELKSYLNMNTYVKWGDPWFWQKLSYFLPHSSVISDETPGSTFFRPQQISGQLEFDNNSEVKKFPDNSATTPIGNSPEIDCNMTFLNGNFFIDVSYVDV